MGGLCSNRFDDNISSQCLRYIQISSKEKSVNWSVWPSGLRRCFQVAVCSGGVGLTHTSDIFSGVLSINTGKYLFSGRIPEEQLFQIQKVSSTYG